MKVEPLITPREATSKIGQGIKKSIYTITLTGDVKCIDFHYNQEIVKWLGEKYPRETRINIVPLAPFDWDLFVELQRVKGKKLFRVEERAMVSISSSNGVASTALDKVDSFIQWIKSTFPGEANNTLQKHEISLLKGVEEEAYQKLLKSSKHVIVSLSFSIDGNPVKEGPLILELFNDICPKTVENFVQLIKGERDSINNGKKLSYVDSPIHRIVQNGWIQGGDVLLGLGDEGESIYGQFFEDENFVVPHNQRGIISMVNRGPHTNNSQFMITLKAQPSFDKRYVAFGKLLEGEALLRKLEALPLNEYERPVQEVKITGAQVMSNK